MLAKSYVRVFRAVSHRDKPHHWRKWGNQNPKPEAPKSEGDEPDKKGGPTQGRRT
jgi:hypothetical protein